MSTYSRVKSWSSNETLTSTDLNAEFNNIITNTNSGNLNSDNVSTSATWTWTGTHTMSTSSKLALIDNIYLTLGSATDGDYFLRYSASNTALELSTTNADGSGTNAVVVDIQDGTDDVRVRGGLSTDNNTAPTTGLKVGGNIVSDTDSTDDLGTTSVRWANVYTDAVGDSGQTLGVKATTLSFDAASTIDTSGNNALTLDAGSAVLTLDGGTLESDATTLSFDAAATIDTSGNNALSLDAGSAVLTLDGGTLESDASTFSFDAAATIDTSGNNNLTLSAGTGTLVATAGDMTLFDDNNNADVSLSLGTSATEALVVQALNGGSNKTLEELRITTKTASGTGDHGKMSFYVDEAEIATIDDGGIDLASGKAFTVNGSALSSGISWDGSTANGVATYKDGDEATVEANLTFDGSTLTVSGALSATGNVSFDGGSFVFNESGADKDFRIEGDTEANLFVADASTDRIGIGTATPAGALEVVVTPGVPVRITDPSASANASEPSLAFYGSTDGATRLGYVGIGSTANSEFRVVNSQNDAMWFGTNNTERMRILSGGGLTFNGDTATANALDDYEEGTFSPVMKYTPSGGSATAYTIASGSYGSYVKIGQFVWFNMQIQISNAAVSNAADTVISFTGLPYASNADVPGSNQFSFSTHIMRAWAFNEANATLAPYVPPNSSTVNGFIYYNNGTAWASLMSDQIYVSGGTNYFQISGSYRAA